jgi:signal transduction histidine kinase
VSTEADRQLRHWEAILATAGVVGLTLVWATDETSLAGRFVATALIGALAYWWLLVGKRLTVRGDESWRGSAYLFGVLLLFAPVAVLVPDASWMLLGLSPQAAMVARPRIAVAWLTVLNVVPPVVVLVRKGSGTSFLVEVIAGIGVVVFSYFVVNFIDYISSLADRLAAESERRAELITELEASRAQVAALSREAGVGQERERLAGEIHDTLAQGFTSILTLVQAAETALRDDPDRAAAHLSLAATTARENLGEARALVGALTPAALGTGTLVAALRRQSDRMADECGIAVRFAMSGDLGALAMPVEVVLLRAAQEALANVRKHSKADTACLRLDTHADAVRLVVDDDGAGFDPAAPTSGFGLRGMRSRIEQIGGTLTVHSGSAGTSVLVEVPR